MPLFGLIFCYIKWHSHFIKCDSSVQILYKATVYVRQGLVLHCTAQCNLQFGFKHTNASQINQKMSAQQVKFDQRDKATVLWCDTNISDSSLSNLLSVEKPSPQSHTWVMHATVAQNRRSMSTASPIKYSFAMECFPLNSTDSAIQCHS